MLLLHDAYVVVGSSLRCRASFVMALNRLHCGRMLPLESRQSACLRLGTSLNAYMVG